MYADLLHFQMICSSNLLTAPCNLSSQWQPERPSNKTGLLNKAPMWSVCNLSKGSAVKSSRYRLETFFSGLLKPWNYLLTFPNAVVKAPSTELPVNFPSDLDEKFLLAPSSVSKLGGRHTGRLIKRDKLTGCGRGIGGGGGGGGLGRSQIMRRQESLVPYASFNSLWGWLVCADFLLFCSEKTYCQAYSVAPIPA